MKPHPRIRKSVKWGGLVAATGLVLLLALSTWYGRVYFDASGHGYGITAGSLVEIGCSPRLRLTGVANFRGLALLPHWSNSPGNGMWRSIPLWMPALVCAAAAMAAWRRDRRARDLALNQCPRCGYDRSGLAAGAVCPECEAAAPQHAAAQ